jgi:hypothetical protein
MANAFAVLWTLERCRWLQRVEDHGPLEVVFGGPHISLPSIDAIRVGDVIFPICVVSGALHVIARMEVAELLSPEDYVHTRLGLARQTNRMWDDLFHELKRTNPGFGHRLPTTCCDRAAAGVRGSELRFDRPLSSEQLDALTFGPKPGREKPLKGVTDGKLRNVFAFHGHVRRLSEQSAAIFSERTA